MVVVAAAYAHFAGLDAEPVASDLAYWVACSSYPHFLPQEEECQDGREH